MKGFMKDDQFHPIKPYKKKGVRKSRDQTAKTEGLRMKRNQKEKIISSEDWKKQVQEWRDNSSDLYKIYVKTFPDSHIAWDLKRAGIPNHGHFGNALYEGRYEDAMYRADAENLVKLHELGLEHLLSKESRHPDDRSPHDEFISRYNWAKEYVKTKNRFKKEELNVENPLNETTTTRRTKAMIEKLEMKNPVLSEKEINWIKNNINGSFAGSGGKPNEFGMKAKELIDNRDGGYKITDDQNQKGLDWLKKKPQQNAMGQREKSIVDNFDEFRLAGFYDAGNSFRSFFVPLWKVREKPDKDGHRGTFLYYNSGGIQIIG